MNNQIEDKYCTICLWNDSHFIFNDEDYALPPLNTKMYELYTLTGYNPVVNQKSYNQCYVCNDCLLDTIFGCNYEKKYYLLQELKQYMTMKEFIKPYNIPKELEGVIHSYLY